MVFDSPHQVCLRELSDGASAEETLNYFTLYEGGTWSRSTFGLCMMAYDEIRCPAHNVQWHSDAVHVTLSGMKWNMIAGIKHTAGPVDSDLLYNSSWASQQWRNENMLDTRQPQFLFHGQCGGKKKRLTWWHHSHQIWGEHWWGNDCTVGGRTELIHKHTRTQQGDARTHTHGGTHIGCCQRPVFTKQHCNMTISCHPSLLSSPVTLTNVWETKKHMMMTTPRGNSLWFTALLYFPKSGSFKKVGTYFMLWLHKNPERLIFSGTFAAFCQQLELFDLRRALI